jgi:Family of unknown function (DUF6192)
VGCVEVAERPEGDGGVVHGPPGPGVDRRRRGTVRHLPHPAEGKARWTPDEANRRVGRRVVKPVTPQEKVNAIHTLAQDEEVAATVTGDLLRRPAVVAQVKDEDKVRAVEELTREDQVAAAVAPDFLRRPAVVALAAYCLDVSGPKRLRGRMPGYRLYTARWSPAGLEPARHPLTIAGSARQLPADPGAPAVPLPSDRGLGPLGIPRVPLRYERAVFAGAGVGQKLRATAVARGWVYDVVAYQQAAMPERLLAPRPQILSTASRTRRSNPGR